MRYVKIIFLLSILGISYYLYRNFFRSRKISPYKIYAHLIKGTYRVGYLDLDKEYSIDRLEVQGTIPQWLNGTLLRNGPAKFTQDDSVVINWLDGLAMLHAFSFDNGKVSYANKFLKSDDYKKVQATGKMNYAGFVQDPCGSIFKKLFIYFIPNKKPSMPNANVNISKLADAYVALTEVPLPIAFDLKTLETLGAIDFADQFPKSQIQEIVHPHYDPINKEQLGFFTEFAKDSAINVYSIKDGTTTRQDIAIIPVKEPSYMHSFAITPNYIILSLIPFVVNPLDFIFKNKPFIKNFKWKPEQGTQLAVIDRKNKKLLDVFKTEPYFTFHHVNASEKNSKIIVDIVIYDDPSQIDIFNISNVLAPDEQNKSNQSYATKMAHPILKRFEIDLSDHKVNSRQLCDEMIELPRINYDYNGKDYNYVYAGSSEDTRYFDSLLKINVKNGEVLSWSEKWCYPGEPVFISNPENKDEDDGIVMSIVLNGEKENSFLLILNAKDMKEMGRAIVPHRIPFGLHGIYKHNQ